ncbi:hypothetical protein K438DRAFT_1756195 [Mycena galopus ATCC 62051]|nr:hypothetical protein K438DRAFT_1756195 [Mycena galopus ATCC 62051]
MGLDTEFHHSGVRRGHLVPAPTLIDVRLVGCDIAGECINVTRLHLGVSHFSLSDEFPAKSGNDFWITLLCPENLCKLDLRCQPCLFGVLAAMLPFPRVHTLTIILNYSTTLYNLSILSKFPGLQILSMLGPGKVQDMPVETSAALPILQQYTGPCETMALFLPLSTLKRLTIQGCIPKDFTKQLQANRFPIYLTSLDVTFDENLDMTTLHTVCTFFPTLTTLRICISFEYYELEEEGPVGDGINHTATKFLAELIDFTSFPAELRQLALDWNFFYTDHEVAMYSYQLEVPQFDELRDILVARLLALTKLWLDTDNFLFNWRKTQDGAEDQHAVLNDYSDNERMKFDLFWEVDELDTCNGRPF